MFYCGVFTQEDSGIILSFSQKRGEPTWVSELKTHVRPVYWLAARKTFFFTV
jgi:hypothetical protein